MTKSSDNSISVITVARNCAPLLKRTIESVAQQDFGNKEYIIIDGASTDGCQELISQSPHVDNWISEPDKGIYDAMNKGAAMASGKWIIFMNAGDTFAGNDSLSRLIDCAINNPEADVIYGDVIRCGSNSSEDIVKPASDSLKGHRLAFCHQSVICKKQDLLYFPFDISHRYSADFKFFKILEKKGKIFVHAKFPVARFDTTGISTRNRAKGLADNMLVIKETDGILRGLPSILHLLPTYIISRLKSYSAIRRK